MKFAFNIGDIVEITNTGYGYSSYSAWAEKNNLSNFRKNYCLGSADQDGKRYVIVTRNQHSLNDSNKQEGAENALYGIRREGDVGGFEYIIGQKGLKLVRKVSPLTTNDLRLLPVGTKVMLLESKEPGHAHWYFHQNHVYALGHYNGSDSDSIIGPMGGKQLTAVPSQDWGRWTWAIVEDVQ